VQNFKPVGPRISEISRVEKKNKNTSRVKLKSVPQAIGRTKNDAVCLQNLVFDVRFYAKSLCRTHKYVL